MKVLLKTKQKAHLKQFFCLGLCRVDLLIEQILRIDPKSNIPSAQINTNTPSSFVSHPTSQPTISAPVLRMPQQALSGRMSTLTVEEKPGFKPILHQPLPNNLSHPSPINSTTFSQFRSSSTVIKIIISHINIYKNFSLGSTTIIIIIL